MVESSPVIVNGKLYVGCYDNKTYAVDATTGASLWNSTVGYDLCVQSSPAYANGKIFTGGAFDNVAYTLDAATGAQVWSFPAGNGPDIGFVSAPALSGNMLYIGSRDNKLYTLDATSGALQWTYQTNGRVYSSPAIVNGVIYFASYTGIVYAVGQPTNFNFYYIVAAATVAVVIILVVIVVLIRRRL